MKQAHLPIILIFILILCSCVTEFDRNDIRIYSAPSLLSLHPQPGDTNTAKNTYIVLEFDQPMDLVSIQERIKVVKNGTNTAEDLNISLEAENRYVRLQRTSSFFEIGSTYTVSISPGIKNIAQYEWNSSQLTNWTFTVVDRLEDYAPTISFTAPIAATPGIYYAFSEEPFWISGKGTDISGRTIISIGYQYQNTNNQWIPLAPGSSFDLQTMLTNSAWSNFPATNRVFFRVVAEKDEETAFGYTNFAFVIDSWTKDSRPGTPSFSYSVSEGFDYLQTGSSNYFVYTRFATGSFTLDCEGPGAPGGQVNELYGDYYNPDMVVYNSNVYIAVNNYVDGHILKYIKSEGFGWEKSAPFPSLGKVYSPQMGCSSSGIVSCVFYNESGNIFCSSNIQAASTNFITNSASGSIYDLKMAFDGNNNIAHIITIEGIGSSLRYIRFSVITNTVLEDTELGPLLEAYGVYTETAYRRASSICLDSTGNAHIVFRDGFSNIVYRFFDSSNWQQEVLPAASLPGTGDVTAVSITYGDNSPHIAFLRGLDAYYARYFGGNWSIRKAANNVAVASMVRIAFQKPGPNPQISIVYHSTNFKIEKAVSTNY